MGIICRCLFEKWGLRLDYTAKGLIVHMLEDCYCFQPHALFVWGTLPSCLLPPASCLLPPASCLPPPASCLIPPASRGSLEYSLEDLEADFKTSKAIGFMFAVRVGTKLFSHLLTCYTPFPWSWWSKKICLTLRSGRTVMRKKMKLRESNRRKNNHLSM